MNLRFFFDGKLLGYVPGVAPFSQLNKVKQRHYGQLVSHLGYLQKENKLAVEVNLRKRKISRDRSATRKSLKPACYDIILPCCLIISDLAYYEVFIADIVAGST